MTRRGRTRGGSGEHDVFGFDDPAFGFVSRLVGPLVPQWLSRRALAVGVDTDREEYPVGEPIELTITMKNRLPVPVELATDRRRVWGWTVDGFLEASDERYYAPEARNSIELRAGEARTLERTWDGRFKRVGSPTRWVEPEPGTHEIGAFVATANGHVGDTTTVELY